MKLLLLSQKSDDKAHSGVSEMEDNSDNSLPVKDVIPVSVTESDNSADDNFNWNNACSVEDDNRNDGPSKKFASKNGMECTD
jgi:hypothetical protein